MKKSSLITKASSRRISRNRIIARIAIVGLVALLLVFLVPKVFTGLANVVLTPIHATESWLLNSKDSLPYFFRDRKELVSEIMRLKATPPEGVGDKLVINRLRQENEELRNLLNEEEADRKLAGVIGRPNVLPYDVLVIDQGSSDGLEVGMPVYVGSDTVIGIIKKTSVGSSLVELVTSPNFKATVYIYGPNIYTTAVGQGGGVLRVGVPQGIDLNEGDTVVLPSVQPGIFGSISAVQSLPTQPEQYGFVTPEIPLGSLRLVAVGSRPLSPISFEEARDNVQETYDDLFTVPVPEDVLVDVNSSSTIDVASSTEEAVATSSESVNE